MADQAGIIIKKSPLGGRGAFMQHAIEPGEEIVSNSRALVTTLDEARVQDTCDWCFLWTQTEQLLSNKYDPVQVFACTKCKKVKYCSKKCQTQAWKAIHKYECPDYAKATRIEPSIARAAARLSILQRESLLPDHVLRIIDTLSDGEAPRQAGGSLPELNLAGVFRFNAYTLVSNTMDPLGIMLDHALAMLNHSCQPNAYVMFDGPSPSVRSLEKIAEGEEVLISYIDETMPFHSRQAELKERYAFECKCPKCEKGPNGREDVFLHPLSKMRSVSKVVLDAREKRLAEKLVEKPIYYVGPSDEEKFLSKLQALAMDYRDKMEDMDMDNSRQMQERGMAICRESNMWPITRQPYADLRQHFMAASIGGHTDVAWKQAIKIYLDINPVLRPQSHHPLRTSQAWALYAITLFFYQQRENPKLHEILDAGIDFPLIMWQLLKQLLPAVEKSHGPASRLTKAIKVKRQVMAEEIRQVMGSLDVVEAEVTCQAQWTLLRRLADSVVE